MKSSTEGVASIPLSAQVRPKPEGDGAVFLFLLTDDGHPRNLRVVRFTDLEADLVVSAVEVGADAGRLKRRSHGLAVDCRLF